MHVYSLFNYKREYPMSMTTNMTITHFLLDRTEQNRIFILFKHIQLITIT